MTAKKTTKPKARPKPKPQKATAPDPDKGPDASKPLSNARWERFAQLLAMHGMSQTQAYTLAGYIGDENAARANASRLIAMDTVRARLTFLQAQAAALAIDTSQITKTDVLNMVVEQHQRNIGVRPVTITRIEKTGKNKGKAVTQVRYAYNEHAASQTAKLLMDEYGLGDGASGNRGSDAGDIAARAGIKDPGVAHDIERLGTARRLALAGGTDVTITNPERKKA